MPEKITLWAWLEKQISLWSDCGKYLSKFWFKSLHWFRGIAFTRVPWLALPDFDPMTLKHRCHRELTMISYNAFHQNMSTHSTEWWENTYQSNHIQSLCQLYIWWNSHKRFSKHHVHKLFPTSSGLAMAFIFDLLTAKLTQFIFVQTCTNFVNWSNWLIPTISL